MAVKRLLSFANRHFLRRSLPHGIISWHYLTPHPACNVRIHRRLWLLARTPRLPLLCFFLIEFLLWLRWVSFSCWRYSWRAVRQRGQAISDAEGIGRIRQFRTVLSLSLLHCVPPSEIYAFGLYQTGTDKTVWDYIFTHECSAFHQWRSSKLGERNAESSDLLQDKLGLTDLLKERGIPMAPILGVVPRGTAFDPNSWLQKHPQLFCKPRHGSAGRHAFIVLDKGPENKADLFEIRQGASIRPMTLDRARNSMHKDDYLIQPVLENHPDLLFPGATDDAVTVRLITERHADHNIGCYFAVLEIPDSVDEAKNGYHIILPIEFSSGRVFPFPEHRLPVAARQRYESFYGRMGRCVVPFWEKITESAVTAHRQFPDIYAIAWDCVVTPDGPYMLEGNSVWGTTPPQMLHGGLLKDGTEV